MTNDDATYDRAERFLVDPASATVTPPGEYIPRGEARRLLRAAIGDAADAIPERELPRSRAEFDAMAGRHNGAVDHAALTAMMRRLGMD